MADPRAIHEFTTGEVEATTLLLGDFVDLDAQSGYTTYKASVSDIGEVILEDIEYTQDLATVDKTIIGAINENKSVIGYSYDAYDATTAYSKDDLCIYNNVLYKAKQATTGNLPTNTTYWEQTSIADEIGRIDTALSEKANASDVDNSTVTITRKSGVSSSVYLPSAVRRGHVITILFDGSLIAGTYNSVSSGGTWEIDPKPRAKTTSFVNCDGMKGAAVMPDGTVGFYSNTNISSTSTIVGSITFITGD